MKKLLPLIFILCWGFVAYADYTGTVTTNQSELTFSTNSWYDVVALPEGFYTKEIGAPQLPVRTISILIPIDKMVSSITINSTTIQQLSGTYNIYPVQTPIPTNMTLDSSPFDDPNPVIYNSTNPYPDIQYTISSDGYPMGYHVVTITFYPLEYIPLSKIYSYIYMTI